MNETFIIEISGMAVGIVIAERAGYRFFASGRAFNSIDGRLYATPRAAEKAALAILGADAPTAKHARETAVAHPL